VGEFILGSAPLEWIRDIREKNGSPDSVTISLKTKADMEKGE
jgi:hypothetical protein